MSSAALKKAKRDVRRRVLGLRERTTPDQRARAAAAVATHCLGLPEVSGANTVLAFWTFGSELPTMPLIEALAGAGKVLALPRIVDGDLEARTWRAGEELSGTPFGAMEPVRGRVVPPTEIEVVFTPAVAFDRQGRRVGYGGGFYDRFLPKTDATRIGIGLALQVVGEPLPAGHFDLPVHAIVTEDGAIRMGVPPAG
ncbi:MAG: 5-formyltetrahydrofolate cyclo-ligase [Actinomycetota bacterium]